jgi:hypothetical protein
MFAVMRSVDDNYTLPCYIVVNNQRILVHVLIDTGALQNNYVDVATAAWIEARQREAAAQVLQTQRDEQVVTDINSCVCTVDSVDFSSCSQNDNKQNCMCHLTSSLQTLNLKKNKNISKPTVQKHSVLQISRTHC